jgi:glycosyltransferase involved in cell wall biosynthesis
LASIKYSVIIPVYKNEASLPRLLQVLDSMNRDLHQEMEAVFVIDGSPDQCYTQLRDALNHLEFPAQLLAHSRNFGSFAAIRSGLEAARGDYFAVMAADLQEPPELLITFFTSLAADECDVAIGTRNRRQDPLISRITSSLYWGLYRRLVMPDMPEGGVDIFGCNRAFRDQLLKLEESRSSLISLIFWLGFRRKFVGYNRQVRHSGKSAWTLRKKIDYMMDSIFAFTDYPIRLLLRVGIVSSILSISLAALVATARFTGIITVPGYAATMLVVLIFGALNLLGLGLIGMYAWRGYENSKRRPLAIVSLQHTNARGS